MSCWCGGELRVKQAVVEEEEGGGRTRGRGGGGLLTFNIAFDSECQFLHLISIFFSDGAISALSLICVGTVVNV